MHRYPSVYLCNCLLINLFLSSFLSFQLAPSCSHITGNRYWGISSGLWWSAVAIAKLPLTLFAWWRILQYQYFIFRFRFLFPLLWFYSYGAFASDLFFFFIILVLLDIVEDPGTSCWSSRIYISPSLWWLHRFLETQCSRGLLPRYVFRCSRSLYPCQDPVPGLCSRPLRA